MHGFALVGLPRALVERFSSYRGPMVSGSCERLWGLVDFFNRLRGLCEPATNVAGKLSNCRRRVIQAGPPHVDGNGGLYACLCGACLKSRSTALDAIA